MGQKAKDTEEAESILESFLEQVEDVSHKLSRLEDDIDDTQEILTLKLNNRRNMIIRFDLIATIITGILALLTLVTGIFGMNVLNKFEDSQTVFFWINIGMMVAFVILLVFFGIFFRRRKIA